MVILPLEEYESLIDEAFGPSSVAEASEEGENRSFYEGGRGMWNEGVQENRFKVEGDFEEEEAESMIEIGDEIGVGIMNEAAGEAFDDEAEIDEVALIDLWKAPTAAKEAEMQEKLKEVERKKAVQTDGGEEQFYLERID